VAGNFVEPTVFADVPRDSPLAREEVFGPVGAFIKWESMEEAVEIANETDYALAAGVWSSDVDAAFGLASRLDAGTVWINGTMTTWRAAHPDHTRTAVPPPPEIEPHARCAQGLQHAVRRRQADGQRAHQRARGADAVRRSQPPPAALGVTETTPCRYLVSRAVAVKLPAPDALRLPAKRARAQ
jgi:delta 1-pyrroline-5-carboxylate dehydrogenase